MGELHEIHLAEVFGGTKTKASGSQWTDPADGANHHDDPYAFRWDGKSTRAKSLAITLAMIEKIAEQAGGERPAIGLRWYGNDALTDVLADWVAVRDVDWSELLDAARKWADVQAVIGGAADVADSISALRGQVDGAQAMAARLGAELDALGEERDTLRERLADLKPGQGGSASLSSFGAPGQEVVAAGGGSLLAVPGYVPMLPWTVIHQVHLDDVVVNSGIHYGPKGYQQSFTVNTVIVERELGSSNRPRLVVNGHRVAQGALYVDGHLNTRVAASRPEIEAG